MGAIASGGGMVLDETLVRELGISDAQIRRLVERERVELHRHLFEEPGALDHVTELAERWFSHHLGASDRAS